MEPTDRADTVPTDRVPTAAGTTVPADRPGAEWVPIAEAARRLGISLNATHQRRKRGTLAARKTGPGATGWVVELDAPRATQSVGTDRPTDRPTDPTDPTDRTVPTDRADLGSLIDLVDRLARENRDLAGALGMWQERARVLEDRVLALGAGDVTQDAPRTRPAAPGVANPSAPTDTPGSWWRRWWRALRDGP